jgi:hypothetical protein
MASHEHFVKSNQHERQYTAKVTTNKASRPEMESMNSSDAINYVPPEFKPYLRVWASVLLQAILEYAKYRVTQEFGSTKRKDHIGIEKKRGLAALSWIFTDQSDEPKSFKWTCSVLGHDFERVRRIVKRDWQNLAKIRMEDYKSYGEAANDDDDDEFQIPESKYANYGKSKKANNENNQPVDVVEDRRVRSGGAKKWAFSDFSRMQASK